MAFLLYDAAQYGIITSWNFIGFGIHMWLQNISLWPQINIPASVKVGEADNTIVWENA